MTRAHRRWHFWLWVTLGPAAIAITVLLIALRPSAARDIQFVTQHPDLEARP